MSQGMFGFLDFTGLPVGPGEPSLIRGGFQGAGKVIARMILAEMMARERERSILRSQRLRESKEIEESVIIHETDLRYQKKLQVAAACYTVLLAEL